MVTPSPPAASDVKTSYDHHADGSRTSLAGDGMKNSHEHPNSHAKSSYETGNNDNLSAAYDDLQQQQQQHRLPFMKPDTLEELLGHRVNFYNGTHMLCARNTSLPPALNGSDIHCLYALSLIHI